MITTKSALWKSLVALGPFEFDSCQFGYPAGCFPSFIIPLLLAQGLKNGAFPQTPPKKSGLKFHGESTHPWTSDPEMSSEQKKRLALGPPRFRPTDPAPEIPPHMPGVGWDPKIILDLGNLYPLVN